MTDRRSHHPLHGIIMATMLAPLIEHHGWAEMRGNISIKCFNSDRSVSSSLTFAEKALGQ